MRATRRRTGASGVGLALGAMLVMGCSSEAYETGDGRYSYLRADFSEIHTVAAGEADYAVTDDGDTVTLQPHAMVAWAAKPDSLYRGLLYHNLAGTVSEPVSVSRVPVLLWTSTNRTDTLQRDPLTLESSWVSANGKYLNLALVVKTGNADAQDVKQTVGLVRDTSQVKAGGGGTVRLILTHRQNGVPEYYSSKSYVSIPLTDLQGVSTVVLSVNSYDGQQTKIYNL